MFKPREVIGLLEELSTWQGRELTIKLHKYSVDEHPKGMSTHYTIGQAVRYIEESGNERRYIITIK